MSYNGVGLSTPRGSATSGYIQTNIANRALNATGEFAYNRDSDEAEKISQKRLQREAANQTADVEILEHRRKRKVEVACMELQDELEEQGLGEDEIDEKVENLRRQLTLKMARELDLRTTVVTGDSDESSGDREATRKDFQRSAITKHKELSKMRDAFDNQRHRDDRGRDRSHRDDHIKPRRGSFRERSPPRHRSETRSRRERSPPPKDTDRGRRRQRRYSVDGNSHDMHGSPCRRSESRSKSPARSRRRYRSRSTSAQRRQMLERRGSHASPPREAVRSDSRDRSRSPGLPY